MSAELLGERYQLTRELVRHPSYTVYEARDRLTEAPIGVTVVLAADGGWPASRRPFAQRLLRATHPHVVAAYDTGVYDDRPFVAFLRPARVLAAEMAFAPCSAAQVKRLGAEIASGLAALHQAGIRLGALHPGHIGVDADGAARLSPWPLASPPPGWGDATNWSPPEMLAGSPPTVSGDIWSLGAVMLATLIGPGPGGLSNGRVEALAGRLRQTVEPTLMQAIGQSMAAEPAQRFASASQVSSLLDSAFGGGQGATRVATQPAVRPREAIAHPSRLAGLRAVACTSAAAAMVASAVLASGKLTTLGTAIHTTSPPTAAATGTASNRQDSCAPARRTVTNGKTAACTPWPNRQDPVPMAVGPARTGAAAPVIAPRATNPLPPWRGSSVGFRPPVGSRAQTATLAVAATGLLSPILSDQPADTGITTNGQDDGADTSGPSLGAPLVEPPTPSSATADGVAGTAHLAGGAMALTRNQHGRTVQSLATAAQTSPTTTEPTTTTSPTTTEPTTTTSPTTTPSTTTTPPTTTAASPPTTTTPSPTTPPPTTTPSSTSSTPASPPTSATTRP